VGQTEHAKIKACPLLLSLACRVFVYNPRYHTPPHKPPIISSSSSFLRLDRARRGAGRGNGSHPFFCGRKLQRQRASPPVCLSGGTKVGRAYCCS
jgi:hypothetical protein